MIRLIKVYVAQKLQSLLSTRCELNCSHYLTKGNWFSYTCKPLPHNDPIPSKIIFMSKNLLRLTALLCLFASITLHAQISTCQTCTNSISTLDSTSYTLNAGDTLCITPEGTYTGSITLNGGVLCNSGSFVPDTLHFQHGKIINTGSVNLNTGLQLGANSIIENSADAAFNISGFLSVNHTTSGFTNEGSLNVVDNVLASGGSIVNSGVINCNHAASNANITGTGTINETSPN